MEVNYAIQVIMYLHPVSVSRMKKHLFLFALLNSFMVFNELKSQHTNTAVLSIIPQPDCIVTGQGHFRFDTKTTVVYPADQALEQVVMFFSHKLAVASGIQLRPALKAGKSNYIVLSYDEHLSVNKEGYILIVSTKSITIKCKTPQGAFYALQTLMQLLPSQIESKDRIDKVQWLVPCVNIKDEPRFSWRGLHLDVGRHFMSIDFIKKQLDVLALFKINKFHWHLTEDQGWRIEIKKHPQLTSIGAKRTEGDGSIHEGFYTQEEIKEVVAYAKARYIDVVPEIEMPGHALACLSAYPELSCTGGPFIPRNIWGVETEVFCSGKEETFEFLEDVIQEIVTLFPFEYIHIGGDECPKERWESCNRCQIRMSNEKLKDSHELQGYFIQRIEKIIQSKGKKMIGWDEIMEGGLSPSANIMSWRGEEGGIAAANQGHDVIMSPSTFVYLNFYQGDRKIEPIANDYDISAEHIYHYEPVPEGIAPEKVKHILGAQANLWSEYIYNENMAEYQLYPRIIALAELTWTKKANKSYADFQERLNKQWPRLDEHHINYYIPLPEGPTSSLVFTDSISVAFSTPGKVEKIVYTRDGSEPNASSSTYQKPLSFKNTSTLRIASVLTHGKMSPVRTLQIKKQAYKEAQFVQNVKQGLRCKTAYGYYLNTLEMASIKEWKESIIDSMEQANTTFNWGISIDPNQFKAIEIDGFIEIPEDGIYFFSSDQDQVWIADQLVVNNDGEVKRFSRNDGAIALRKGKHTLKIVYLNNIIGGWPSDWNRIQIQYRKAQDPSFRKVKANMCFYTPQH